MSLQIQLKKSAVSQKQPFASDLAVGELALNYNADGPFLTCKDTEGNVRKLNNVWVAAAAPTNPTAGDLWLDTNLTTAVLKVYKDSTSGWVNATTIPVATTSIFGTVRLATSSDITNGTSGKVVDAAQLQSKITDLLSNDVVLNGDLEVNGDLTVNGTTTTIDTETLIVEDKNIEMGVVATPTDNTADGGGITLKGATDKTLNWVNATDSWTSSENLDLASGKSYRINGTEVLSATALGSAVQISSANIPNGTIVDSDINAAAEIAVSKLADGDARQLLQTDAAGTGVEWTSNVDVPGTLDVTGAATFDSSVSVTGALTKSGNNVVTVGDTGTVTSTMIANNTIVNEDINASAAIADTKLDTISTAGKVSNSATTATSANTASAIVARDASGNFTAGTVTASLAGNADTATKLNSTRTFAVTGDVTGTVSSDLTSGATIATSIASGVIVDADINASAEIAVSKLADGDARQLLQTDAAGTGVEWTSNVDVPGTLDVTGAATLDSTLTVPLGSEAAPTVRFTGDPNTGIYSPGADQLALSTNGTGRLTIDGNGNVDIDSTTLYVNASANRVGVGTLPQRKFHVHEPSAATDLIAQFSNATTGSSVSDGFQIQVLASDGSVEFNNRENAYTAFKTNNTERLRITSAGLVGIGTSLPGSKLEVADGAIKLSADNAGKSQSTNSLLLESTDTFSTTGQPIGRIEYLNKDNGGNGRVVLESFATDDFGRNDLRISVGGGGGDATSTAVTVTPQARVGIGTTSPSAILHVNTSVNNSSDYYLDGGATALIRNDNESGVTSLKITSSGNSTSALVWGGTGSETLIFANRQNERARIDSSGRLLVGTSSSVTNGQGNARLQVTSNSSNYYAADFGHYSGDAFSGPVYFKKTRSTTAGGFDSVVNGDFLGDIRFAGADGSGYVLAAKIDCRVDGTPGTNDMPGRLVFSTTADGASSPTERLRIDSNGFVSLGGDTNTGFSNPSADNLAFTTGGSERARIDSSGRLLVGTSTARSNFYNSTGSANLQVEGIASDTAVSITANSAAATPQLVLNRSKGTTVGSNTLVAADDFLGGIQFQGSDGTEFVQAAVIAAQVDGTPGANEMPGRLVFSTTPDGSASPTERMRITNDGFALFGTTSKISTGIDSTDGCVIEPSGAYIASRANNGVAFFRRRSSDGTLQQFRRDTTIVGTISVTTSSTAYNTTSDYRLKENVVDLDGAIDRLKQLPVRRFNFISDPDTVVDGFLAHEAAEVVPEAVTGSKDEVDDEGNPVYQGIDQSKIVPLLTQALKDAIEKIETLEAKVAALETP